MRRASRSPGEQSAVSNGFTRCRQPAVRPTTSSTVSPLASADHRRALVSGSERAGGELDAVNVRHHQSTTAGRAAGFHHGQASAVPARNNRSVHLQLNATKPAMRQSSTTRRSRGSSGYGRCRRRVPDTRCHAGSLRLPSWPALADSHHYGRRSCHHSGAGCRRPQLRTASAGSSGAGDSGAARTRPGATHRPPPRGGRDAAATSSRTCRSWNGSGAERREPCQHIGRIAGRRSGLDRMISSVSRWGSSRGTLDRVSRSIASRPGPGGRSDLDSRTGSSQASAWKVTL